MEARPDDGVSVRTPGAALAFAAAAAIVLLYALRGGAYDIVVRQEYALAIWSVVALGFALGLLPRTRPSRLALVALAGIVLLAAWTGLSLIWSSSAERTVAELCRVTGYGGLFVLIVCVVDRQLIVPAAAGIAFAAVV